MEVPAGSGIAGDTFVDNAGRSTLYGLEAEFAVSEGLSLSGSLGLLATESDEFDQGGEDLSGNEFSFAPGVTATVGARYRHASGLFGTVQLAYADGYYSDPQNFAADEVDDRFLFDGRLGYERAAGASASSAATCSTTTTWWPAPPRSPCPAARARWRRGRSASSASS